MFLCRTSILIYQKTTNKTFFDYSSDEIIYSKIFITIHFVAEVPMNKIQVGNAPSPNIKAVKSKIGSLENATYKPGGGKVKIENRKIEFGNVTPRIAAKNDAYIPSGGTKKVSI